MSVQFSPQRNPRVIIIQKLYGKLFNNEENITLEKTQTIDSFNKKIFTIRKDLREVQRELGENIKKLETNLKLINIWLMPLLVIIIFYIFKYISMRRYKAFRLRL